MTTTVKVWPHPAEGLVAKVTLTSTHGGDGTPEYLRRGDTEKTYHAHDGMSVKVEEVPEAEAGTGRAPPKM